jgi:type IV pilus assembly protein PilV
MMRQRKRSQAGFSLVELLVAMVVLAIGLLGLAELQITTMKSNAQSDSIMVANHLAQKIIEEVAATPADDPRFASNAAGQVWAGSPYDIAGAGVYNVTYDVAINHGGVEGLSQITVHVASAGEVMNVLGMQQRLVNMATLKRTF